MTADSASLVCLTTSAAFGGAETSLLTLLTALQRSSQSWRITVVTPGPGPLPERCRDLGFDVVELPFPAALTRSARAAPPTRPPARAADGCASLARRSRRRSRCPDICRRCERVLRRAIATVVHSNGLKAHVSAALAKPAGTRLVWHLHDYVRSRPLTQRCCGRWRGAPM